jgi:hypothetical protein
MWSWFGSGRWSPKLNPTYSKKFCKLDSAALLPTISDHCHSHINNNNDTDHIDAMNTPNSVSIAEWNTLLLSACSLIQRAFHSPTLSILLICWVRTVDYVAEALILDLLVLLAQERQTMNLLV